MISHKRKKQRGPFQPWPAGSPPADQGDLVAWLRIRPTVQPFLAHLPGRVCVACRTPIEPGDTAWRPVVPMHLIPQLCHRCGVLLALHSHAWSLQELRQIPAIGGPPAQFTIRRPKSYESAETA